MPFLQLETGRLYYQVDGVGDPVVFVNDCGFTQTYWYPSVSLLKQTQKCVTFDARGFGGSQPCDPDAEFDIESQGEDLHRLIGLLGLGEVHLVAHGLGSLVAGACLRNHPQDVRSLTLVNLGLAPDWRGLSELHARLGQTILLCRPLLSVPVVGGLILRRYSINRVPAEYRGWLGDDLKRANPRYYWALLSSALEEQTIGAFWKGLTSTSTPLLFIASANDRLSSLAVMRRAYNQVASATLATMNKAAHFPMLEFTGKFAEILLHFYRKPLPPPRISQV